MVANPDSAAAGAPERRPAASEAAPAPPLHWRHAKGGLSFFQIMRSPLGRRVAAVVFGAILAVELVILIPSYFQKQKELLGNLRQFGVQLIATNYYALGADADRETLAESLLKAWQVAGVRVIDEAGQVVVEAGEPIVHTLDKYADAPRAVRGRTDDGDRYETLFAADETPLGQRVFLRLDGTEMVDQIEDYAERVVILMLVIAVVLTGSTMLAMGIVVLRPLLELRDALAEAEEEEWIGRPDPAFERRDEVGEVYRATADLMEEIVAGRHDLELRVEQRTAELRDSEARFRDFTDASSDFYWEMDERLRFTYVSERFAELTDVHPDEVLGKDRGETWSDDLDAGAWRAHLGDLEARRPFRNFVRRRTRADGSEVYTAISGNPVFDAAGEFAGYRGTGTDVTEQRRAEDALKASREELAQRSQLLTDILESCPVGVTIELEEGRRWFVNARQVRNFAAASKEQLIGADPAESFVDLADRARLQAQRTADGQVEYRDEEVERRRLDGSTWWASMTRMPFHYEGREGQIVWLQDITERRQAAEALRESERRLTSMLDSSPIGVAISDREGRGLWANSRIAEMLGRDKEVLRGTSIARYFAGAAERERVLGLYRQHGYLLSQEVQLQRSDGTGFWALLSAAPFRFGQTEADIAWVYDVTEQKEAEARLAEEKANLQAVYRDLAEKEGLLRKVLDNVEGGILMYDRDLNIQLYNRQALRMLALPDGVFELGRSALPAIEHRARRGDFGDLAPDEALSERIRVLRSFEGERLEEFSHDGHDYESRWSRSADGSLISVTTDITDRKRAERDLRQAMERAEAFAQAKSEIVAVVSHEIRTPMNGVLGMANLLRESHLDGSQLRYVDTILVSGESLLRIVDDLLDSSKLEAGKLELDPIPFLPRDMVEQSTRVLAARAIEKGLTLGTRLDPAIPEALVGDSYRLRQVLLNLLSNAVKFTERGSVEVSASLVDMAGGRASIRFAVSDTGRGIREETRAKLFSPYMQESVDVARRYGGTGLGLTICRRLIELMGGEILLDSEYGKGSVFHFTLTLPLASEAERQALLENARAEPAATVPVVRKLRLLQVEDNEINRDVLERVLARQGHEVTSVVNGAEALKVLAPGRFDAVLMDRHMPEMSGIEATERIRAMPEPLGSIPIIGITAGASEAELEDCLNAGMSAVLTKPLNVGDLYEALREVAGGEPLPAPAAAPPADAPKPASPARLPVLLVDDTPINLAVAGKQLDRLGLAHEAATGGAEALAMLERADYAMALVDISMPDIDGLEFTLRRREHEAAGGRRMPIVAMTGHASAEDRRRFLAAGMDGVLAKPIRREELAAVVEAWIPAADAVPTEATAPAAAVPIDLAGLGRILDSTDRAELLEVAAMFAEQAPGYAVAIHEAVAAGDRKALAMAAHRARGAAANVAAETLRGIVAALEDEAEAADWGRLRQLDGTIDAEVERILEFIRAG